MADREGHMCVNPNCCDICSGLVPERIVREQVAVAAEDETEEKYCEKSC